MSKTHQHFIPQTYLKNFSYVVEDKHFLDGYNKGDGSIKKKLSVKDVCVDTDLYTLKHFADEAKKYVIEDFFANSIEPLYPAVYKLLTDQNAIEITFQQRVRIMTTILSMYFRTPKALNKFVAFASELILNEQQNGNTKVTFDGLEVDLDQKGFRQIRKEIREHHRLNFISAQLSLLHEFVRHRLTDGLVVIKLVGEQEFITSDNPVEIRSASPGDGFSLFDTQNVIYSPLDPKHALFIAPSQEDTIVNRIFRQRDNSFQHIMLNHSVHKNAERWVLGTETGVLNFAKDNDEYSKPGTVDHPMIKSYQEKDVMLRNLVALSANGVSKENEQLSNYINSIKHTEVFKNSIEFQDIYNQLKEMGLEI